MGILTKIGNVLNRDQAPGKAAATLEVDVHSHLLPGIDDGAKTLDDSLDMIERMSNNGIRKIITTPHIMYEYYRNTPEIIRQKLEFVQEAVAEKGIQVELRAAAEYYLDDAFIEMVQSKAPLLCIGEKKVLVETNYIQAHPQLEQVFFDLKINGYQPVFAHPERYSYMVGRNDKETLARYRKIFDTGILFQMNLLSFTGYYGPQIKKVAELLLKEGMLHLVGSDAHRMEHVRIINQMKQTKLFERITAVELQNNSL